MRIISIIFLLLFANSAQSALLKQNLSAKTVMIADKSNNLQLLVDYSRGSKISQVISRKSKTMHS